MQIAQARWALLTAVLLVTGCSPGVRWRLGSYEDAFADARTKNCLTFVYFRNWAAVACTHFEEHVLKQQAVLDATADMVCVPLQYAFADRRLGESWGVERVPGFAIIDPAGVVLETASGPVTADELLEAIQRARQRYARQALPTTKP